MSVPDPVADSVPTNFLKIKIETAHPVANPVVTANPKFKKISGYTLPKVKKNMRTLRKLVATAKGYTKV